MALIHRKLLATTLLVAIVAIGFPAVGITGGCDEPGYTGGSCGRDSGSDPTPAPPAIPGEDTGSDYGSGGSAGLTLPTTGAEIGATSDGFLRELGRMMLNLVMTVPIF